VAQETGWDLTRVNRYAEPPIRERAYVAKCASEVHLHHARGSSTLEAVVCTSLGLTPEELVWDSAYLDGQWLVQIQSGNGSESAQWSYEPAGKTVNPLNPMARTLMGLDPVREALAPSARESTIIVDTTASQNRPQIQANTQPASVTAVKLAAVPELAPELFALDQVEAVTVEEATPAEPAQQKVPGKKARKGRAKVPSWDEILFGSTSQED
jgi:hypothetical protein